MLRAAAAAASAFVFAAAADEKAYPASYWEVEEMNAAARSRRLSSSSYVASALFPSVSPVNYDSATPEAEAFEHQKTFGSAAALSGNGEFFVVGQPGSDLPFTAPPTAPFPTAFLSGVMHFGERSGTEAAFTQRDITGVTAAESTVSADPKFGSAVAMSHDGGTIVTSAIGLDKLYVFKHCRSDNGCKLVTTIVDPNPTAPNEFGKFVALSPDASYLAASTSAADQVYVWALKPSGAVVSATPITVLPPTGYTLGGSPAFGVGLKLTSKGRRLIIGSPVSPPDDVIFVYRREAGGYYVTDTLKGPVAGVSTGFGFHNAIAVSEDSGDSDDEDAGARFTLVAGQQGATSTGQTSIFRCLKGLSNTCALKTTISASTSLGESKSIGASVAVSQRGEYVAISGVAVVASVAYGTVHIYKRSEESWTYSLNFASYVYGTGTAITSTVSSYPLSLSRDGKVLLAGSGVVNGAATLITRTS